MKLTGFVALGCLAAYASAAPAPSTYVVHERRELQLQKWSRRDLKLDREAIIPLSIGLKQRNLEMGHDYLMDVSHPDSPNFGKHWSMEKIAETFAPSEETVNAVKSWLMESGIPHETIKQSKGLNWIKFNATVKEAEFLLRTEYAVYTNAKTGKDHLACEEYSVPPHIQEHIDFITPTIYFDAYVKTRTKRRDLEGRELKVKPVPMIRPGNNVAPQAQSSFTLENCDQFITPECLRALYGFKNGSIARSSYGIVEYTPEAQLQSDMDLFFANLARQIPAGTGPITHLIDGAVVQTQTQSFEDNGESDLDLQYAISLVYPQRVTLYQVGDLTEGASFGNFLDAIDASYCTSGGGDDPNYDGVYPDTLPGGYAGKEDCGKFAPASVISTSYAYNEADLPAAYEIRQCHEYLKLGLFGTTFIFSSGDNGVAGNGGECCTNAGCAGGAYNAGKTGTFNPSFPGTCPYVTSVGATQIKPNTSVTATNPEQACETVIYSGGGFSNVFPLPQYQSSAVRSYFANHKPSYTAAQYNNSRTVRGYPDVAVNGANYVAGIDGVLSLVYGTSASAPVFGSIITLINEERSLVGKGPVGFINPALYSFPSAFTDITSGGNQGCGTAGFSAVPGWDPVTGLGTPDYKKLLRVFLSLP